jgi:hypothetical protein
MMMIQINLHNISYLDSIRGRFLGSVSALGDMSSGVPTKSLVSGGLRPGKEKENSQV